MTIEVREATLADVDAVASIRASALTTLRQTYRPNEKALALRRSLTESLTRLVAVLDGRVVGSVEYHLISDRIHFISLDVHADFRRQGVARQLVAELTRIGRRVGVARLSTYTVVETGNLAIFERIGFHVVSQAPSDFFKSDHFETLTEAYLERTIEPSVDG